MYGVLLVEFNIDAFKKAVGMALTLICCSVNCVVGGDRSGHS